MVLLFASCGLLSFLLFCCEFFHFSQKRPPKKRTLQKPKKTKMQTKGQTKKSVSAVVFTNGVPNFWGWATKMLCFAESPIKLGVLAYFEKGKKGQKCEKGRVEKLSKVELKSVQLCCAS